MAQPKAFLVSKKDLPILRFLWWWKFASTAAVAGRYFSEYRWTIPTVHWRLNRLKNRGLVTFVYAHQEQGMLWTLTQKGFVVIEPEIVGLRERGYASEHISHDLVVQAAHLGDFLPRHSAPDVRIFSEQELRRIDPEFYPLWVPQSSGHRPDGYWGFGMGDSQQVVALEVECSDKTYEEYRGIVDFYDRELKIGAVLWIVRGEGIARKVLRAGAERQTAFRLIHSFVRLDDFREMGWQASIFSSAYSGKTIEHFLTQYRSMTAISEAQNIPKHPWARTILDLRRFRVDSVPYEIQGKSPNRLLSARSALASAVRSPPNVSADVSDGFDSALWRNG